MQAATEGVEQPQPSADDAEEPLNNIWRRSAQITTPLFLQIDSRALNLRKQICFRLKPLCEYNAVLDTVEELVQTFISKRREHLLDLNEDEVANVLASVRGKVVESFDEWQALVEDWKGSAVRRIGVLTQEMAEAKDQLFQSKALVTGLKINLEQKEEALVSLKQRLEESNKRCLRLSRKKRKLKEEGKHQARGPRCRTTGDDASPKLTRLCEKDEDCVPSSSTPRVKTSMEKYCDASEIMWCKTQSEIAQSPFGSVVPRRSSDSRLVTDQLLCIGDVNKPPPARSGVPLRSTVSGDSSSSITARLQNTMENFSAKLARRLSSSNSTSGQVQPVSLEKGADSSVSSEKEVDGFSSSESEDSSIDDGFGSAASKSSYTTSTNLTKGARPDMGRCALAEVEVQTMLSLDSNAAMEPQQLSYVSLECLRTLAKELTTQSTDHVTKMFDQVGMVSMMLNELDILISAVLAWLTRSCTHNSGLSRTPDRRPSTSVEAHRLLTQLQSMMARCAGFKLPNRLDAEESESATEEGGQHYPASPSANSSERDRRDGSKLTADSEFAPAAPRRGFLSRLYRSRATQKVQVSPDRPFYGRLSGGPLFRWTYWRGQGAVHQLPPAEAVKYADSESTVSSSTASPSSARSPLSPEKRIRPVGGCSSRE